MTATREATRFPPLTRRRANPWVHGIAFLALVAPVARAEPSPWNPFQLASETRRLRDELEAIGNGLAVLPEPRVVAQAHQRIGFHGRAGDPAVITVDLGQPVQPDEVILFPARVSDPAPDDPVGGFPPEVTCLLSETSTEGPFTELARWKEPFPGAGQDPPLLRFPGSGASGRFLRLEIRGSRIRAAGRFFTLGEVVVLEGGTNRALGAQVATGPSIETPPRWSADNLTDGFLWCGLLSGVARSPKNGFHSAISPSPEEVPRWVETDLGEPVALDEIRLVPARPADFADVAGFGFPPSFAILAYPGPGDGEETPIVLFDSGDAPFPNPGEAAVCFPGHGIRARRVRVVANSLWRRSEDYIFALAELQVFSGGRNVALGRPVRASDVVVASSWAPEALVDGFSSQRELLDWTAWLDATGERARLEAEQETARAALLATEAAWQETVLNVFVATLAATVLAAGITLLAFQGYQARMRTRLRQRIARDLHDEVGSQLSHLALLAEHGQRQATRTDGADPVLGQIADTARDLQHTMRDLVWLLEPAGGDAGDLTVRIRTTCQRLLAPAVDEVEVEVTGDSPAAPLRLEWARDVLLFVKEAVSNCARHSRARSARIRLQWLKDGFRFELADDGTGFDETAPGFAAGAGLRNLRLRAGSLGGTCDLVSRPGEGTKVELLVPL